MQYSLKFDCIGGGFLFLQVGAPPEIADVLDEIHRESDLCKRTVAVSTRFGSDPELDQFMVLSLSFSHIQLSFAIYRALP